MPDSLRQILTDTRELLSFIRETGMNSLPRSEELDKFLRKQEARPVARPSGKPLPRPARPAGQPASSVLKPAAAQPLEEIDQELAGCTACSLHAGRKIIVSGSGSVAAGLLIIEDQPGLEEETTGNPFAGEAGELFDRMLKAIGLKRQEVYLTSLVKCRPPEDRDPTGDEIKACQNHLARQIAAVNPAIICVMGPLAAHLLTGDKQPLFRMRGKLYDFHGTPLLISFHPRFLLRNPEMKKASWQDLQLLQKKLRSAGH